jgi:hypothetical protein
MQKGVGRTARAGAARRAPPRAERARVRRRRVSRLRRPTGSTGGEQTCEPSRVGFRVGDGSHEAVSRRPPISLDTMVPRTGGLRVRRWGLGFVHRSRTILCRAVAYFSVTIRNFCIAGTAELVVAEDKLAVTRERLVIAL